MLKEVNRDLFDEYMVKNFLNLVINKDIKNYYIYIDKTTNEIIAAKDKYKDGYYIKYNKCHKIIIPKQYSKCINDPYFNIIVKFTGKQNKIIDFNSEYTITYSIVDKLNNNCIVVGEVKNKDETISVIIIGNKRAWEQQGINIVLENK